MGTVCTLVTLLRRSGPLACPPDTSDRATCPPDHGPTIRNEVLDEQTDTTAPTAAAAVRGRSDDRGRQHRRRHRRSWRRGGQRSNAVIADDDLGGMSLEDAIDATIVEFDDGDIVSGKSSRSTPTKCSSTSATSPKASSPRRSCRFATTSTPTRSCRSASASKRWSSKKRTKTAASSCRRSARSTSAAWGDIEQDGDTTVSSAVRSSKSSRVA